MEKRYYPYIFKNTILCTLPKSEKRPWSLPQLYFLIVLLFYLGKVLEQVIVRLQAYIALKYNTFSLLYFDNTYQWLVDNTIVMLTNDMEKIFQDQKILIAFTFDIKEAFNRVIDAWLI